MKVVGTIELEGHTWAVMLDGSAYRQNENGDVYIYGVSFEPFFDFRPCEGENCDPLYLAGPVTGSAFARYNVSVEVPAGSYNGWKFTTSDLHEWSSQSLAPGVGMVKYSDNTDCTPSEIWELISYNIVDYPVHVAESEIIPSALEINNVYPNPFNLSTAIEYNLPQNSHITLSIYNISGQRVSVLKDEYQQAGTYTTAWDATGFPSGLYFCTLEANGFVQTRKMLLMK
ncbi:T9SS type A sorting domain-containing protein [Candidatus Latescibacterota bacterium]